MDYDESLLSVRLRLYRERESMENGVVRLEMNSELRTVCGGKLF
jgi:hypothetical protein